jgi:hypothetical protein
MRLKFSRPAGARAIRCNIQARRAGAPYARKALRSRIGTVENQKKYR